MNTENKTKFKRIKRFLFNSENFYKPDEIIINWLLAVIAPFLIIVFGIAFYAELKGLNYSPNDLLHLGLTRKASTYSIIAFVGLILLISSWVIKVLKRGKRKRAKRKEKQIMKKGERYYDGWKK